MWNSSKRLSAALALASFLLGSPANASEERPTVDESATGEPIVIGYRHRIESKVLGESRSYIVHKPNGYDFSSEAYPVIVLLDGDANMLHVSATMEELAKVGRSMPMLVVGVENTDRQRDMTPVLTNGDERPRGAVGGADKFLAFLGDELLPEIDRKYRTRPARILIGHSFSGLFAIHALLERPGLFKGYIAISPSLWWDNQALAKRAERFVANNKDLQTAVYITIGNEGGAMLGGAQKVAGALASSRSISVNFQHWPDENHGSVAIRSVYEGLKWLHESYYIHDPVRLYEEGGLQPFEKRFQLISQYLGYEVKIPEWPLMHLQAYLMEQKRIGEAREVLQRVVELYPRSPGAHYELGRVSLVANDPERAEAELKQTLMLYPGHAGARAELKKLGIDPKSVVTEISVPVTTLREYVGEYRYGDEVSLVTLEGGKLFMKVGNDKRQLLAHSEASFFAIESDREYTFNRNSGRVKSLTIELPNFTYESLKVK